MRSSLLYIPLFLLLVAACKQKEKPLTKEEVKEFGQQAEISIGKHDKRFLGNAMDQDELISRMRLPKGMKKSDLKSALDEKFNMGELIVNSISPKGTYNVVRQYEKDGVHHLVFRLYKDGSLNYHDFEFIRSGGSCKIADFYVYLTGENISETLSAVYEQMFSHLNSSSNVSSDLKWVKELSNIRSNMNQGKFTEAKALMEQVPQTIRHKKQFLIMNIEIASELDEEEYQKALALYEKLYPGEPNLPLLMVDGYFMSKEYEKGVGAIDKLDAALGGDPFLDYHRSLFYKMMENQTKRLECLEKLRKNEPDFEDGRIELIAAYLDTDNREKARSEIELFRNHSAYDQGTLSAVLAMYPGYEE